MSYYTKGTELDVRRVLAEVPEGHVYKGVPLHEHGIMWTYSEQGERKLAIMADSGVDYEAVLVEDDKDDEAWFNSHLSNLNEGDIEEIEKSHNILFNMALELYPERCGVSNFSERVKVLHNEGCPVYSIRQKFGTYDGPLYIVSNGTEYRIHSGCFTADNMNEWMYRLKFRRKLYPTWDVLHGEDVELAIEDIKSVIAYIEGGGL